MKKIRILAVLSLLLIVMLGTMIFRYEQLEKDNRINRYIDRWTGIEWVEVRYASGESRMPAKYYQNPDAAVIPDEETIADLVRIANTERILTIVWWVLLFVCFGGITMKTFHRKDFQHFNKK